MNQTPRVLNRLLLGLFGAVLMAVGAAVALLAVPAVATWWQSAAAGLRRSISDVLERTTLAGQQDSWLWIVVGTVMLLVVILMVAWVAAQGRGRSGTLAQETTVEVSDDDAGRVTINGAVAEQALKAALQERGDLVNAAVTTYEFDGEPALRIRVFPRPGVSPHELATEVTDLVEALDLLVGRRTPVLISISSGARTRFTRTERVR
ncbi:Asp23/Gls24 family envelope stress response protein [Arthrobacter sp. HLT1-21]